MINFALSDTETQVEAQAATPESEAMHIVGTPTEETKLAINIANIHQIAAGHIIDMFNICNDEGIYDPNALKIQIESYIKWIVQDTFAKGVIEGENRPMLSVPRIQYDRNE